jgi:hypothetical protein
MGPDVKIFHIIQRTQENTNCRMLRLILRNCSARGRKQNKNLSEKLQTFIQEP